MIERYKDGRKLTDGEIVEDLRIKVNGDDKRHDELVAQIEQMKKELRLCMKCWKKRNSRSKYGQYNPNPWKKSTEI